MPKKLAVPSRETTRTSVEQEVKATPLYFLENSICDGCGKTSTVFYTKTEDNQYAYYVYCSGDKTDESSDDVIPF